VTDKFYEPEDLSIIVDKLRSQGKKIGLSHGVFDLLHPGHIQHFIAAKKEVDFLIVSITSDAFVNKGPGRPIFAENIRISTLSALSAVDYVTISRGKTAEKIIESIRPMLLMIQQERYLMKNKLLRNSEGNFISRTKLHLAAQN
jgi:cytidyltransferase-like protein